MILRANAGDWIEVTLHNMLDPECSIPYFDYPSVPLDKKYTPSTRVSLNPQFLKYDPVCDSGINVGYNGREQTVDCGESKNIFGTQIKNMVFVCYSPSVICEITDTTDYSV